MCTERADIGLGAAAAETAMPHARIAENANFMLFIIFCDYSITGL
jgi:hypothetical protein